MCPSVALSEQQCSAIQPYMSAYQVLPLTGKDGVDKWTDQNLWDAVLSNVRVVVGTPAVLADALHHGFVRMSRLALLVFDEGWQQVTRYCFMLNWLTIPPSPQMHQEHSHEHDHEELLPSQQVSS